MINKSDWASKNNGRYDKQRTGGQLSFKFLKYRESENYYYFWHALTSFGIERLHRYPGWSKVRFPPGIL